jgi:hypothetical protein
LVAPGSSRRFGVFAPARRGSGLERRASFLVLPLRAPAGLEPLRFLRRDPGQGGGSGVAIPAGRPPRPVLHAAVQGYLRGGGLGLRSGGGTLLAAAQFVARARCALSLLGARLVSPPLRKGPLRARRLPGAVFCSHGASRAPLGGPLRPRDLPPQCAPRLPSRDRRCPKRRLGLQWQVP